MKAIKFRDRVSITARMWRGERHEQIDGKSRPVMAWRRRTGEMRGKSETGVFLGWRTVQRGWTVWGGEYEGNHFKICGYDKVALVSLGPKENPVYIHPDDMEKISTGENSTLGTYLKIVKVFEEKIQILETENKRLLACYVTGPHKPMSHR